MKSLTESGRRKIMRLYLQEMSPCHDSVVICADDGKCPGCVRPLSDSGRGWGFCRNRGCELLGKMQRFFPKIADKKVEDKKVEEIIKDGCEETAKGLLWLPGQVKQVDIDGNMFKK